MEIKCSHDNGEFEIDKKTGALICSKCHCIFRVCLVKFDPKCYKKQYPELIKELMKEQREKKHGKRGRPKKKQEKVVENETV